MRLIFTPVALFFLAAGCSASMADQPSLPTSIKTQHEEILQTLSRYSAQDTPAAAAAQRVLDLMRPHLQKEEELVLPLLAHAPDVAEGRITAEMTSAIAVANRLKEEKAALFDEHSRIMGAVGELVSIGERENAQDLVDFSRRIAAHAMSEVEVLEPAAILVGNSLRRQLEPGK